MLEVVVLEVMGVDLVQVVTKAQVELVVEEMEEIFNLIQVMVQVLQEQLTPEVEVVELVVETQDLELLLMVEQAVLV